MGLRPLPMLTLKPKQAYLMGVMRQHGRRENPIRALETQCGVSWRCRGMLAGSSDRSVDETKSLSGIPLIVDGIDQRCFNCSRGAVVRPLCRLCSLVPRSDRLFRKADTLNAGTRCQVRCCHQNASDIIDIEW